MVVMFLTIGFCFIANNFFLEVFYTKQKVDTLLDAYQEINEEANDGDISNMDFAFRLQALCETHNISVIIYDLENNQRICSGTSNPQDLMIRLINNFYMGLMELEGEQKMDMQEPSQYESDGNHGREQFSFGTADDIYMQNEDFTIRSVTDTFSSNEYIEMWGFLDNGDIFMIRTMKAAIKESVKVSNRFLLYTGIVAVVIGSILIIFISDKMTKPILRLSRISEKMKVLDFEAKYETRNKRKDEIDQLGENINLLSETLEKTIQELKTANVELQKDNEKKTQIDEMRKEFLSNVTHELKTPIALIQGYAEGLKEGITDDPESMDFYCDVIIDEATKMNQMVKKLLTLNHLEFGTDQVVMEHFDIVAMISNYLSSSQIVIKQNELDVQFIEKDPIYVWGDEFKTEEVFTNYFTNAMNHVDQKKMIDIKISKHDGVVRVSVFNSGESIPAESIPYIWDKFYKVDKARTREYGGSGVGLSIVKASMESMNQKYGVINYDEGVEFWFELDAK